MSAGDGVNVNRPLIAIVVGMALVLFAILAFRSGYEAGSDLAERENAEEAQ